MRRALGPAIGVVWIGLLAIVAGHGGGGAGGFAIAMYAIAIGAALGALATGLAALRARLRDEAAAPMRRAIAERVALVVLVHTWIVLGGMARAPQLYSDAWYARGALRRTVQVIATDVLGPGGVAFVGFVALVAYLFGSPEHWRGWRQDARRSLSSMFPRARRSLPPAALGCLALSLLLLAACGAKPRGSAEKPDVVLFVTSSLRADRLDPRVAPNLAALAARGTRFDRAYATIGASLPSLVTLLTGRDPHHHGVRADASAAGDRARDALPARFAKEGWATALVSDAGGRALHDVDLGFARSLTPDPRDDAKRVALAKQTPLLPFLDSHLGRDLFPAMRGFAEACDPDWVADDAIRALDRDRDRPLFLTVMTSAASAPYGARAPWYARFTRKAYRGRFKYDAPAASGGERADDEDVAQERALYDGAVASEDAAIGRVLAAIDRRGMRDRTIVAVVSDHGELLHEDGHGRGHGGHLFGDAASHVPMVIVDPRGHAVPEVASIVRDVDLAPTLYALAKVAPPADLDGRALDGAMRGEALAPGLAFGESAPWHGDVEGLDDALRLPLPPDASGADDASLVAKHRSVRDDEWKLVYAPTRGGARWLLFDLEADPGERRDVAAAHPVEVARLEAALWRWMLGDDAMTRASGLLVPRATKRDASAKGDASGEQVSARLVESLNDARIDAPSARGAEPLLAAHARKTRAHWSGAHGDAARFAWSVALASNGGTAALPTLLPAWNPETRPWMAGEGTFDRREAIVAPTPSTFAFKLRVPLGARLSFAPATMNRTNEAVVLSVSAVDARGAAHDLASRRIAPAEERRWLDDVSVDLSAFAGETIELRLHAQTAPATHEELVALSATVARPHKPATPTGGAAPAPRPAAPSDRALAVPSPIGLALWGDPVILERGETSAPYDVVWISVDSLAPSAPSLAPIAAKGIAFTRAYAAATWPRPSIAAMLAGARATELGLDPSRMAIADEKERFYASAPPLLPLVLRESGVTTRAFAGDVFLEPELAAGVDLGFERTYDVIAKARDARAIASEARAWIGAHADARFFAFVELPSDAPLADLVAALDAPALRDRLITVVTADRVVSPAAAWEEATHVPLVVLAPPSLGLAPPSLGLAPRAVDAPVRAIDLAPTILDLEGIDAASARAKMSGRSLLPLARGETEPDPRVVVGEGHAGRAIRAGDLRLVVRDGAPDALFDLASDPSEKHDVAKERPDDVAAMRARLAAALANVPVAGSAASLAPNEPGALVHLRFAGAAGAHRVAGRLSARGGRVLVESAPGLAPEAWRAEGGAVDVAFVTAADGVVGLDVRVSPKTAPLAWELTLDDAAWPADRVYAGAYGIAAPKLAPGLTTDEARAAADARALPYVDPARDLGLFVARAIQ